MLVELDTRQERAQLAAVDSQRDLADLNFDRMQGLLTERVISRAEFDRAVGRAETDRSTGRRDRTPRSRERRFARRSRASSASVRSTSGSIWRAGDPIVLLQSLDPIYVELRRAAAGCQPGPARPRACASPPKSSRGRRVRGARHRDRLDRGRGDAERSGAGDAAPIRTATAARHVRPDRSAAGRSRAGRRAAGIGDQLRAVRRFGVHRHRPKDQNGSRTAACASSS